MASLLDIDLGCSAAVLCRKMKALDHHRRVHRRCRRQSGDSPESDSKRDAIDCSDNDSNIAGRGGNEAARSFTVSCRMTAITASSHNSSSSSSSSSSGSSSTSRTSSRDSSRGGAADKGGSSCASNISCISSRHGKSWRRRHSSNCSSGKSSHCECGFRTIVSSINQHQHQYQYQHKHQSQQVQLQLRRYPLEANRSNEVPREAVATIATSVRSQAPDWTDRLLLVLQPTAEDPNRNRRQSQFDVQRVRQIFCVLFRLDLLAKLLANLPTLKAIVNKTRCCVKLRDALLFKRLPRTGFMVKYMMFSFEGDAKHHVDACLRFLEEFDSAFSLRRPWRNRSGCAPLVLRWNKNVPENTLLSMCGQRLMSSSRLFCCSPIGPNTGWVKPLPAEAAAAAAAAHTLGGGAEEGGVPEGLLG